MGTGLRPNRMPSEWEKRPLPMDGAQAEGPQGPSALRSINSPQAPFPSDVVNVMAEGGGFVSQILAGRPGMQAERATPGDNTNQSGPLGGFPGPNMTGTSGSATRTTGSPVMGQTSGKGTI